MVAYSSIWSSSTQAFLRERVAWVLGFWTGEVAAVNKEFSALTGWSKDILLGKEANLNVNTGSAGTSGTNSGRGGLNTPKLRSLNADAAKASEGKPQPIFIAELMDDDSVVEFYEDYAHLAFGDSRGSVTRKGRLLKYRTQENLDSSASAASTDESPKNPRSSILSHRVARIDGEHGISKIERDGKLECTYCWHIRRDTFDIPMMIVMNVCVNLYILPHPKKFKLLTVYSSFLVITPTRNRISLQFERVLKRQEQKHQEREWELLGHGKVFLPEPE